jgi:hypothetical protein
VLRHSFAQFAEVGWEVPSWSVGERPLSRIEDSSFGPVVSVVSLGSTGCAWIGLSGMTVHWKEEGMFDTGVTVAMPQGNPLSAGVHSWNCSSERNPLDRMHQRSFFDLSPPLDCPTSPGGTPHWLVRSFVSAHNTGLVFPVADFAEFADFEEHFGGTRCRQNAHLAGID